MGEATRLCTRLYEESADALALYYLGVIAIRVGKFGDAAVLLEEAATRLPERADIAYNFGVALRHTGEIDKAIAQWSRAVDLNPGHEDAWRNLARAYAETNRLADAERTYRAILTAKPGDVTAAYNLANTLFRFRRWSEATVLYREALNANPNFADARINLVLSLMRTNDVEGAIREGKTAVECAPDSPLAHWNLSHALLMAGLLQEGFAEFEWRRRLQVPPIKISGQPEWKGFPLRGERVLIYGEQGHGDVLQFLRFVTAVADAGGCPHVVCHPKLVRVAERALGVGSASHFDEETPDFDFHAPLLSLPCIIGLTSFDALPAPPYIGSGAILARPAGRRPRVGIAWRGNPEHADDIGRSCPPERLVPLLELDNVEWVNLQFDGGQEEIAGLRLSNPPQDGTVGVSDFLDTAKVLEDLDLVISVDTAVVHLAGAMDIPVWVLLSRASDWRWLARGAASPWYPSAKLFRQERDDDWTGILDAVRDELIRYCFAT